MKFKFLLENDLITINEIPLHLQEFGEVFARVKDIFEDDWIYIVKKDNKWKPYVIKDFEIKEYIESLQNFSSFEKEPKKLLCKIASNFKNYDIQYIVQ